MYVMGRGRCEVSGKEAVCACMGRGKESVCVNGRREMYIGYSERHSIYIPP